MGEMNKPDRNKTQDENEPQVRANNPSPSATLITVHPVQRPGIKQAFTSFAHRNYRLWFYGQAVSLMGTFMQITAQAFLIYQLTHSPAYLGYIGFASGVPLWLFALFGGVVSDRMQRRTLLLITQISMMVLAFVLAGLTFLGWVQPWHIVLLAFGVGVVNAFDAPARQAFAVELVEREDLANSIALNSTMVNLGIAIGPAIAGLVYASFGAGWCFTLNGISFIAVIAALLMMRLKLQPLRPRTDTALNDIKEGLRYAISHPIIRVLMAVAVVTTVFGTSFTTLIPAWAVNILGGDATTNGFLQSARGVGSLIGALMVASLGRVTHKGKILVQGIFILSIMLLVWSAMHWLPLSLLALVGVGWGSMLVLNMTNILLQSHVTDLMRGRVMSIYTLSFFGMMPVGSILIGSAAEVISEPITVAVSALVTLAFAGWLWLRVPELRELS
jgi:MFS family permease